MIKAVVNKDTHDIGIEVEQGDGENDYLTYWLQGKEEENLLKALLKRWGSVCVNVAPDARPFGPDEKKVIEDGAQSILDKLGSSDADGEFCRDSRATARAAAYAG